jgi:general secretion pathway protein C
MLPAAGSSAAGLRGRIAALTPRERQFLVAGALALLLFLAYLLWPSDEGEQVELAATPPPAAPPAFVPPPVAPAPVFAAPAAPLAAPDAVSSVMLRGVMGGGASGGAAIVSAADGVQRVVRVGREIAPGITLRQIGVNYAIVSSGGGDIRLELNKIGGTPVAPAAASPVSAVAAPGAGASSAQRETTQFRLGLQPVTTNGRISGYAVKPGANLPRLQQAGLQPGDVIVSVNGSQLDEERLMELSWQLSNSQSAEFEYIRNGQRMKGSLK